MSGTTPCVSALCLSDVITHDQISQAFPSVFAYCKQSKPENEAKPIPKSEVLVSVNPDC